MTTHTLESLSQYVFETTILSNLEPIGLDTPLVEALTSYISRLSTAHSLHVQDLLLYKIIPHYNHNEHFKEHYIKMSHIKQYSSQINGLHSSAKDWSNKFQELTGRNDLYHLTLLQWQGIISFIQLQNQQRKWCPGCYEELRLSNKTIYDPLIWTLQVIKICGQHQMPLISICPNCSKSSRLLESRMRPGYCPWCNAWLGSLQTCINEYSLVVNASDKEWQDFVWASVRDLLSFKPISELFSYKNNIPIAISLYLALAGKGGRKLLSNRININPDAITAISEYRSTPKLTNILKICVFLHLSIIDILTCNKIEDIIENNFKNNLIMRPSLRRVSLEEQEVQSLRKQMNLYCGQPEPPSLYKVVRQLGYNVQTIRYHAPEQAEFLTKRTNRIERNEYLQRELSKASIEEPPPTKEQIIKRLKMTQRERRVLFIDELNGIVARSREHRNKLTINKRQEKISQLQQMTRALYEQGIFPSGARVCEQLGWSKAIFKDILMRQTWEDTLSQLQHEPHPVQSN